MRMIFSEEFKLGCHHELLFKKVVFKQENATWNLRQVILVYHQIESGELGLQTIHSASSGTVLAWRSGGSRFESWDHCLFKEIFSWRVFGFSFIY